MNYGLLSNTPLHPRGLSRLRLSSTAAPQQLWRVWRLPQGASASSGSRSEADSKTRVLLDWDSTFQRGSRKRQVQKAKYILANKHLHLMWGDTTRSILHRQLKADATGNILQPKWEGELGTSPRI